MRDLFRGAKYIIQNKKFLENEDNIFGAIPGKDIAMAIKKVQ